MAAGLKDTRTFFTKGSATEWEYILSIYKDALNLKAQRRNKKPEELIKLDGWYQDELPKLIQSRKDRHVVHSELVQTMKWKLLRGKWRPRLTDLVRINTPAAVVLVSKKAFRKLPNLASAVNTLSSLKGIGPATASAILAAGAPELAPYMADECLQAIPECQSIDYTVQEYLIFTEQIQVAVERLNETDKNKSWNAHKVEKALWTYCVINEFDPSLLHNMPQSAKDDAEALPNSQNGKSDSQVEVINSEDQHLHEPACKKQGNGAHEAKGNGEQEDEGSTSEEAEENGKEAEPAETKKGAGTPSKNQCEDSESSCDTTTPQDAAHVDAQRENNDMAEAEPASKKLKAE